MEFRNYAVNRWCKGLWQVLMSEAYYKIEISVKVFIRYDLKMRMQVFLLRRGVLNSPNRFPVPCGTLNLADVCNQNRGRPWWRQSGELRTSNFYYVVSQFETRPVYWNINRQLLGMQTTEKITLVNMHHFRRSDHVRRSIRPSVHLSVTKRQGLNCWSEFNKAQYPYNKTN